MGLPRPERERHDRSSSLRCSLRCTPAKTPAAIVGRSHVEIRKAEFQPKLPDLFHVGGFQPRAESPAEFAKIFRADIERFAEIVRTAKIEPQ